MANPRVLVLVAAIVLVSLAAAFHGAEAVEVMSSDGSAGYNGTRVDCGVGCAGRCELSSRPNLCKRACGSCCAKCNCVPPGTSGNYEACPCYASLTTRGNKLKCP